jgi:hypothetical protein
MGKMKEVFQLQQEMVAKNHSLKDMPDSYFMELYLQEEEYYKSLNEARLLQDTSDGEKVQEP